MTPRVLLPESHHGTWAGPNRLWFQDPVIPLVSDGTITVEGLEVRYTWSYEEQVQNGRIGVDGPASCLGAEFSDTWHAAEGLTLHGHFTAGVLRLYGIYPAGNGPAWGWRIELELNDPTAVRLRMFNVNPDGPEQIAVDLSAAPV